jgi:exodeoxyribonuclease V beta subunit
VAPPLVEIPVSSITTQSFSSLHQQHTFSSAEASSLPKGAEVGNFFHSLFETLLSSGRLDDEALMTREIEKSPFTPWKEEILTLVKGALSLPLDGFTLRDVSPAHMLQEMEFLFTEGTIRWKGFADLVFFHQGYYYLLDWKLHVLSDYRPETLEKTMQNYGYKEQAALYTKALRKLVPQGELGGAFYVFVRGLSVYKIKNTL